MNEAPPRRIGECMEDGIQVLIDSSQHAKFTNAPAEIGTRVGEAWAAYGGKISGRHIELIDGARIVQTWRAGSWPEGAHSIVRFELKAEGDGTKVVLDHDALADDQLPHIDAGWEKMYWAPLRKYLEV